MNASASQAIRALNRAYARNHADEAARTAVRLGLDDALEVLESLETQRAAQLWERLSDTTAARVLTHAESERAKGLVAAADAVRVSRALARLDPTDAERLLSGVNDGRARELRELMRYEPGSAGSLMDRRFVPLRASQTAGFALEELRHARPHLARQLFVVDEAGRVTRSLEIQDLALARASTKLANLARPIAGAVLATAPREEIVEVFERTRAADLPVVDSDGVLLGVIHHEELLDAVRDETSADLLTMVGASRDERALSNIGFVVRKRLPWLHINLVTAFLAAAVVGLFESTIAQFTALAVLLPVVAGQSGNTGAQALAVTMRGLAVHEIGTSHWQRVARKEIGAGAINGAAIALVTALGVLIWSGSSGLALVIGVSMILSMIAAGLSGVVIPIVLSSLGQDPAQSSSIILTTITDVVGFFTFLGIATALSSLL